MRQVVRPIEVRKITSRWFGFGFRPGSRAVFAGSEAFKRA
jgi:hypothetical protein